MVLPFAFVMLSYSTGQRKPVSNYALYVKFMA